MKTPLLEHIGVGSGRRPNSKGKSPGNEVAVDGAWLGLKQNFDDSKFYWVDDTPLDGQYEA